MPTIPQWKLSEFFRHFAPRYLFGSTFTASPVFFETSLLTKINRKNLEGAVVVCDQKGYQMAAQEVGALRAASSVYSLLYPPTSRIFHPKVWVMADDTQVAVLCGSGNMTQSGFVENTELFDVFEVYRDGDNRHLSDELLVFLRGVHELWDQTERNARPGLKVLDDLIKHVDSIGKTCKPTASPDVHFLSSFGGDFPSQLADHVNCQTLHVASPYFGGKLKGLESITSVLTPASVEVFPANHDSGIDISPQALREFQGGPLRQLKVQQGHFAHLKVYGLIDDEGIHHTFTGSVNATDAALSGDNVEAGILRTIALEDYEALFEASDLSVDLRQENLDYIKGGDRQIGVYAIQRDTSLQIQVSEKFRDHLPLSSCEARWLSGPQSAVTTLGRLFEDRLSHHLRPTSYPDWITSSQNTAALEITGVTAKGERFHSFTIIENFTDLTASPAQRNAASAIQSLFSGDGVAEAAGISSFFHLLSHTIDAKPAEETSSKASASDAKPERRKLIPVWPPEIADSTANYSVVSAHNSSIPWMQRVIRTLVQDDSSSAGEPTTQSTESDDNEEGDTTLTNQQSETLQRHKVKAWTEADKQFSALENRLRSFVMYISPSMQERMDNLTIKSWRNKLKILDEPERSKRLEDLRTEHRSAPDPTQNKERVLPTAMVAFLATYLTHPGDGTILTRSRDNQGNKRSVQVVVPKADLIFRFLHLILDNRHQGKDYTVPRNHPYGSSIFPPILEEVGADPELELAKDFEVIIIAFFVLLKIEMAMNDRSLLQLWLKFRHFSGLELSTELASEVKSQAIRFGSRNGELIDVSSVDEAISYLQTLDWTASEGFKQTMAIYQAKHGSPYDELTASSIPNWSTYLQVIGRGGSREHILHVDRTDSKCSSDHCPQAGTVHPDFKQLEQLHPCICHACGTAHVPKILAHAYTNHES